VNELTHLYQVFILMPKIKCLIVDDDIEAINRLKYLLLKLDGLQILDIPIISSSIFDDIITKEPDIIFLANEMQEYDGFEIIDAVRDKNFFPLFIFTSDQSQYAINAIKHAVFGYLIKPINFNELKCYINRSKTLILNSKTLINKHSACSSLSNREVEELSLIIKGNTSQEIAKQLFISTATVNFHRQNILLKTAAKNFLELSYIISKAGSYPFIS
jgi:two-component system response regulator NreC